MEFINITNLCFMKRFLLVQDVETFWQPTGQKHQNRIGKKLVNLSKLYFTTIYFQWFIYIPHGNIEVQHNVLLCYHHRKLKWGSKNSNFEVIF